MKNAADERVELAIMGMHCAGCVAGVEDALRAVSGVRQANVNLATESASLALDPRVRPSLDALIRAVRGAGYDASLLDPIARSTEHRARQRSDELRKRRDRLLIATLLGLPVVLVHMLPDRLLPGELVHGRLAWAAQVILTFLVLAFGAGDMLRAALQAALRRAGTMDLLVSLGAVTAFVAGVFGVITGRHELILFESAVMIVLFVSLGKLLELRSRGRASAVLESLLLRVPRQALRVCGETVESVAVDDLSPGDIVRIVAPTTIPVDGVVVRGALAVDQSMLTGESEPVDRAASDEVLGGCTAVSGTADIRATTTGATCAAARMARLVEAAQAGKPPIQRIADRAAGVFVPVVLLLAFLTTVGWALAGSALIDALTRGIAVLVIACPCAMGLAVPTAVLVGTAAAGARGILVRNVESLEAAAKASRVLLDKTGTLTAGRPTVVGVTAAPSWDEARLFSVAAAIARMSPHPFSKAIVEAAEARGVAFGDAGDCENTAGAGVAGRVSGRRILLGSKGWLRRQGVAVDAPAARAGQEAHSLAYLAVDGVWAGSFSLTDEVLPTAAEAVAELRQLGVSATILSGDHAAACQAIAARLGLAFEAGLTPQDKLDRVRSIRAERVCVAMVGDGINDAPALAAADVSFAIGAGADVAREAADFCLVGRSPRLIADAIRVARATVRVMRQNLAWAIGYNLVMLPVAAFSPIPPWMATAAMMLSSLSVVGNSLRLRRLRGTMREAVA